MKRAITAGVAAALAFASTESWSTAWVTAQLGDVSVSQTGSGPNFAITPWFISLEDGESQSRTFSWSVTVHTDGLPATRTWDNTTLFGCMPLYQTKCGPDPTGSELVEAYLKVHRDGRSANQFITLSDNFEEDQVYAGVGTETFSGTFTLTATNIGGGGQGDELGLVAAVWVDSSDATPAVPEPGGVGLLLAGLSTVLAGVHRRRRAPVRD